MEIGFIGLGRMGTAMARNLVKTGHTVRAWNRSSAAPPIEGVEMVASPADAFQADAVLTMLSDDAAIRDVLLAPGVIGTARPNLIHVVTATISVAFADELLATHDAAGLGYVSAPVFGRPEIAEAGQLNIMVAGRAEAVATVQPLLDVLARKVWVMGTDPKQANAAKIAGNMMITMAIEAMAEAVVLTSCHGLAPEPFFDLILNTLFAGRSYQTYSEKIMRSDYEAGFRAALGLKDLGLATVAAGTRLPMLEAVHARMAEAVSAGFGDKDWSIMADYTLRHAPSLRQEENNRMIRMLVTCNGEPGTRMDRDYYADTHIPLAMELWGRHGLEEAAAFFPADDGNGVLSIGIYRFRDAAAMEAALAAPETARIMADVKNFTDSTRIERSIWAPMTP